jgi:hypothetical protein
MFDVVHDAQENTLDALRDLIERDNDEATGPVQKLAYVEWDVHVSCNMGFIYQQACSWPLARHQYGSAQWHPKIRLPSCDMLALACSTGNKGWAAGRVPRQYAPAGGSSRFPAECCCSCSTGSR